MRFGWALVALILVVGLAGTAVAVHSREADSVFVAHQRSLAPVGATQLERLLLTTRDPRPGYDRPPARARAARCRSATPRSALGDPWTCVVRYRRPPGVRYRVIVYGDRSISGSGQPIGRPLRGTLTVKGCCVAVGDEP
jgi:hypothetical protein